MLLTFPFFALVGGVLADRAVGVVRRAETLFRDIEGSDHVIWSSPIAAAVLGAGWWMRRRGTWRPDPSPEYQALMAAHAERDGEDTKRP